jgi:hypothetical protein
VDQAARTFFGNIGDREVDGRSLIDQDRQSSPIGGFRWRVRTPQAHELLELSCSKNGHDFFSALS